MTKPDYHRDGVTLYRGDCLDVLADFEKGSVDAVITDPPYCGVLDEEWDKQWKTPEHYLLWLGRILTTFAHAMAANGSLYLFASPSMAGRVEVLVREYFNVLASIVWSKGNARNGVAGNGINITALRTWWTSWSERIVFAEQYGADSAYQGVLIDQNRTYLDKCEEAKRGVFGQYLTDEFKRAGVSRKAIAELFPSKTGGLTGCVSNWLLGYNCPTHDQYEAMRRLLNTNGTQYLRREYEDLRRPFYLTTTTNMGDVWTFSPPQGNQRLHPCQKPVEMMEHIINASTRAGGLVLDPFMGSGTTAIACIRTGRKFIGIEIDPTYFDLAVKRIEAELQQPRLPFAEPEPMLTTPSLFAEDAP